MVDRVTIQKIINGYTVTSGWDYNKSSNTAYHKDMDEVCKYLDNCFGQIDKAIKDRKGAASP